MRNKSKVEYLNEKDFIYISALAGTGKTTLLYDYSLYNSDKSITYLCFNNKMAREARDIFPESNVSVFTFHSYAYKMIGFKYSHKITNKLSYQKIINSLMLSYNKFKFEIAKVIEKELTNFCNSQYYNFKDMFLINEERYLSLNLKTERLIKYLKIIWSKMIDIEDDFSVTQDFYLKLFQLSRNGFPYISGDVVIVDEVQDANQVIKDIIVTQHEEYNKKLIIVGDKNQFIYGFRGSIDIYSELSDNPKSCELRLSKTYRFGKSIADVANKVLQIKGEDFFIEPNDKIVSNFNYIDKNKKYAVISRTNYSVIYNLIKLSKDEKSIYVYSNIDVYINMIIDVYNLMQNKKSRIVNPEIKKWVNFNAFYNYYKDNIEYSALFRLLKSYKGDIYSDIKQALKFITDDFNKADVYLGTLHSVKGLEFDQVILSSDFYSPYDKSKNLKKNLNIEELNVLYTAITRAKYNLLINKNNIF